jgi:hypothetical protein
MYMAKYPHSPVPKRHRILVCIAHPMDMRHTRNSENFNKPLMDALVTRFSERMTAPATHVTSIRSIPDRDEILVREGRGRIYL